MIERERKLCLRYLKWNSLTELISLPLNSPLLNLVIMFIGSITFELIAQWAI